MYSKSLNKFFVSEPLTIDSGLACLFGFENKGLKELQDKVLCSQKFINEIQEDWWEKDWVHIGNIQTTEIQDDSNIYIFEGDILETDIGVGYVLYHGSTYCIKFTSGGYSETCNTEQQKILPLDYIRNSISSSIKIISNIYIASEQNEQ